MKRKKAAALKYDNVFSSPTVTAVGFGEIAERIIEEAENNNVPIIENTALTENLTKLSIGQNIPIELYEAVAEIIAFIYSLDSSNK
ncbi:MAG: flhB 1 [Clostridiales bacterium]|jgi:flagellar biosynthesis protein|nr:flhB 1 [Clostridiales bacterium]